MFKRTGFCARKRCLKHRVKRTQDPELCNVRRNFRELEERSQDFRHAS
jgi:hypothetical protein